MEIREYLRIFARYWWVIVVLTVVGAAIGYATWQFQTREYESTATLFVATQNGSTATEAYQNNLFSVDRANSYASLATSEQVAARAVDQLKAPISADELRSKITAVAAPKTVLFTVTVTDPDPVQAQTYANAVAGQLVNLVSELETSRRGGSPAAGAVVVDEAGYPTSPAGLGWPLRVALGAAAGLVLGILAAIIAGVVDKRLRGRDSVETAVGTTVIGGLPADRARARAAVVDLDADSAYADRIRELRTNLRFVSAAKTQKPPQVIAVTSPSRGDGRTTVAIDLAAALAETGKSVVLVDGDLRHSALADRLPLNGPMRDAANSRGLSTVLTGEHGIREGLLGQVPLGSQAIAVLPAGPRPPRPGALWATDRGGRVLEELAQGFDYVVLDTPALDDYSDAAVVAALSDGALLLARIRGTTSTALRRALQRLQAATVSILGTVVTFENRIGQSSGRAVGADSAKSDSDERAGRNDDDTSVISEGGLVGSAGPHQPSRSRHGTS